MDVRRQAGRSRRAQCCNAHRILLPVVHHPANIFEVETAMSESQRIEGFVVNRINEPGATPGLLEVALVVAGKLEASTFIISRELAGELIASLAKTALKAQRVSK